MPDGKLNRLTDTGQAPEYFCSGVGRVEPMGAVVRFTLYVNQISPVGTPEQAINVRVVLPADAVMPAIELTIAVLKAALIAPVTRYIADRLFH
jgi:hypothetical protein